MNLRGMMAIYRFEMARTGRTLIQSVVSPVLSTSLYFVVFGGAIGSRITDIDGVAYGSFIVPGLIMMSLLQLSISNASFAIYFPKFTGTIYEILSAPISYFEVVCAYVGAAATKAIIVGLIILATAALFVPLLIVTPLAFLGGSFYSIQMLPPFWHAVSLFNPVVYLVSGFRWAFFETSDVGVAISLGMTLMFLLVCLGVVMWMLKTGYKLKN